MNATRIYWGGRQVVYRCFDGFGRLLYVGVTNNWPMRRIQHRRSSWWYQLVKKATLKVYPTREAALAAEKAAIEAEGPVFNGGCNDTEAMGNWTVHDLLSFCVATGADMKKLRDLSSPHGHWHDTLDDTWRRTPADSKCSVASDDELCRRTAEQFAKPEDEFLTTEPIVSLPVPFSQLPDLRAARSR